MKTVLHLERKFTSNTETFIVNQVNTINNFNVVVATIYSTGILHCDKTVITPQHISYISRSAKYLSRENADEMRAQLDRFSIGLVHCHYLVDAIAFRSLTKQLNVPKICSAYGYDVSSFPNKYFGLAKHFYRAIFEEYDYFLAMSEDMKKDLLALGCPDGKIIVHYHGIDTSRFYNSQRKYTLEDRIARILTVGTLEEKKAQHLVVRALGLLKTKYKMGNFEYHLAGSGAFESVIREEARKYDLSNNIVFHGYLPHYGVELKNLYDSSDIFVHPSISLEDNDKEGIPGTIVEAMASGLPVISSRHAGIPSIIQDKVHGLLCAERDVEGLAEAFHLLLTDGKLREKLGRSGQEKAMRELDIKAGTRELENIYARAIDKSTRQN